MPTFQSVIKMPFVDSIARNLRQPERSIIGSFVTHVLKKNNSFLEEKAVELCNIKSGFHVLEVGFGPGIGLKKAAQYIKKGEGKIHGIDFSPAMMIEAIKSLPQEIAEEKVELVLGNADSLPYRDNSMDCIYHTNCYYFWPDVPAVARELLRVLKVGGTMTTLLDLDRVKKSDEKGFLKYGTWDPEQYMETLGGAGFVNTQMESLTEKETQFEVIIAQKPE